jgi:hypothetical protein
MQQIVFGHSGLNNSIADGVRAVIYFKRIFIDEIRSTRILLMSGMYDKHDIKSSYTIDY